MRVAGLVPLVHLDPVTVEFVVLERDGFAEGRSLLVGFGARRLALLHIGDHLLGIGGGEETQGVEDRRRLADALVGPVNHLAADGCPFGRVALEEPRTGLSGPRRASMPD